MAGRLKPLDVERLGIARDLLQLASTLTRVVVRALCECRPSEKAALLGSAVAWPRAVHPCDWRVGCARGAVQAPGLLGTPMCCGPR